MEVLQYRDINPYSSIFVTLHILFKHSHNPLPFYDGKYMQKLVALIKNRSWFNYAHPLILIGQGSLRTEFMRKLKKAKFISMASSHFTLVFDKALLDKERLIFSTKEIEDFDTATEKHHR